MLLANYNSKISESKFMLNILEKITSKIEESDKDTCVICFNEITYDTTTVLTSCGHLYCEECIMTSIKYKSECPTCKTQLNTANKLYRVEKKQIETPFINKYGAKLGKLIQMIRNLIIMNKMNRIIVFSQWDDMLTLIGKSLSENGIANSFIKGNVHCRNKAIQLFKQDSMTEDSRVIMLSLKNSASGTNLTEATHIFFVEPINMSNDERKMIEGQAIGRACRLGQKNTIEVIRILCKNTIEEDIYKNNNKNIIL
jgi:SNF2 family DNA or RNA helicase